MGPSPTYLPPEGEECETLVEHGLPLWAEPAVGYCSQRPRPSAMWGSCFVGARAVGPSLGEQKPLGKTPQRGNPSPESTYPTNLPLCVVLHVRCPGPLGSCSSVCVLRPVLCLCGVLGHLAPVHRCAGSVCRVACAVSWATWLLFTGVRAPSVALFVLCSGPPGSCSMVCRRGSGGGRPRTGLIVPAACPCRGRGAGLAPRCTYFGAPRCSCPWQVPPASVLGCARCGGLACVDPVTGASGFPYRPSFDGGLGQCTGAVSCGRRHLPFWVGKRHARVPRVCACACSPWPGRAGRLPRRVFMHLTFPLAVLSFVFVWSPPGWGGPCFGFFFLSFSFFLFFSPPLSSLSSLGPLLSPAFSAFRPWVPWALARFVCSCPPPPFFSLFLSSAFPLLLRPAPLLLLAVPFLCSQPWVPPAYALRGFPLPPPRPFFCPFSTAPPPISFVCFFSRAPLSRLFRCFRPWVPWASSLCACPPPPALSLFVCFGFFLFWRSSFVLVPAALGGLGFCSACLGFFFLLCVRPCVWCVRCVLRLCPPPPPLRRLLVSCCVLCLVVWFRGLLWAGLCDSWCFAVFFGAVWCWCCAVWCVVMLCCWFCRWRSPVGVVFLFFVGVVRCPGEPCCFSPCFVVCGGVARCCAVCCAVCCPGGQSCLVVGAAAMCGVFLPCPPPPPPPPAAAPCRRCLVPCRCPLLCSVLGCGAVLFCCAACRVVWCCLRHFVLVVPCCFVRAGWCPVLLPVVAGCSFLGLVARCCSPLACFAAGAPAWPRGLLPHCVLWFVVAPRSPVLCPVFCGAVLPCGAVLWCPAVCFALLVVVVSVLSLCLQCCVALCVVLSGAGLVCAVVGASCCGVSLCVVLSPLAFCGVVVLPCCVAWCVMVSCCAVLCSVVPCCLVMPCCWAVLCVLPCCGCSFLLSVACVGLGVLVWPSAARPVVWCAGAVFCGVLCPVLCPVLLCCPVVLCCLAVLCVCLCRWFLFFLSSNPLYKNPAVSPYLCKLSENQNLECFLLEN